MNRFSRYFVRRLSRDHVTQTVTVGAPAPHSRTVWQSLPATPRPPRSTAASTPRSTTASTPTSSTAWSPTSTATSATTPTSTVYRSTSRSCPPLVLTSPSMTRIPSSSQTRVPPPNLTSPSLTHLPPSLTLLPPPPSYYPDDTWSVLTPGTPPVFRFSFQRPIGMAPEPKSRGRMFRERMRPVKDGSKRVKERMQPVKEKVKPHWKRARAVQRGWKKRIAARARYITHVVKQELRRL